MITKEAVSGAPDAPGVYFFKNKADELLYVGKSKSLRSRLRSYTAPPERLSGKVRRMVRNAVRVEFRVLGSELEALLVESRLIKELQPPYNVMQKRIHGYPFLKIRRTERFPRLVLAWTIEQDGSDYFGPFPSRESAEEAMSLVQQIFPLRTCMGEIIPKPTFRPCLDHYIGRCEAPCAAKIDDSGYDRLLWRVGEFFKGNHASLHTELLRERQEACDWLQFEKARQVQNRMDALTRFGERCRFQVNAVRNSHLVVVCPSQQDECVELFFVRSGALRRQTRLPWTTSLSALERHFHEVFLTPDENAPLTLIDVDAMNILSQWLYAHRSRQEIVPLDGLSPSAWSDALLRVHALMNGAYLNRVVPVELVAARQSAARVGWDAD